MAGSTRILVTNALHILSSCDSVSVVDNGTVAEQGPYAELVAKRGGLLASMIEAHSITEDDNEQGISTKEDEDTAAATTEKDNRRVAPTEQETKSGVLVKEEKRNKGKVGLDVYRRYLSAGASECLVGCVLVFGFIIPEGMSGLASVWLSVWTSADVSTFSDTLYYLAIYGAITIGAMGLVFARAFTWCDSLTGFLISRRIPLLRWSSNAPMCFVVHAGRRLLCEQQGRFTHGCWQGCVVTEVSLQYFLGIASAHSILSLLYSFCATNWTG